MADQALSAPIRIGRANGALRYFSLASVIALFGLIVLGGVVRITDSGLGCPDWPFCHGKVIPSADAATLIEYSHRMAASVTGLIVLVTGFVVWRSYRWERWLLRPMALAIILLIAQVILGGITVRTELDEGLVMAHLAVAQTLLALMIVVAVVAWSGGASLSGWEPNLRGSTKMPLLIVAALVTTFAVILTGAYVQASGATGACGDSWPLCQGELFPGGKLAGIHMLHRVLSLIGVLAIAAAAVQAWGMRHRVPVMKATALVVAGLFLSQMAIGGINVLLAFHRATNVLHLSAATSVWGALVLLAAIAYLVPMFKPGGQRAN